MYFLRLRVSIICGLAIALFLAALDSPTSRLSFAQSKRKPAAFKRTKFKPLCANPTYPMPAPAKPPLIDSQCGLSGVGGGGPEGVQDAAKNNFCATGTPEEITIDGLIKLQQQVENDPTINFGSKAVGSRKKGPTTDRGPLQTLGEGKLVTLRAFLLKARPEGPESVNCAKNVSSSTAFHDIHISLVASTDVTEECSGVVAEMSPHHRPDSWNHAAMANRPERAIRAAFLSGRFIRFTNSRYAPRTATARAPG